MIVVAERRSGCGRSAAAVFERASVVKNLNVSRRDTMAGMIALGAASAASAPAAAQPAAADRIAELMTVWRSAQAIPLWKGAPPGGAVVAKSVTVPASVPDFVLRNISRPELKVFRPKSPNGRALVVVPGGGYNIVSILNEGLEVAARMTDAGYTVFVLAYRLPGEGWKDRADVPLQDAQRAMRIVRDNARRYGFDPANVAVLGFSAGGHLAASLATGFAEPVYAASDAIDRLSARPAAAGLIYPVIAMDGPYVHQGSCDTLLGPQPAAALIERRSPARHVGADTPPAFLVHTLDDPLVPTQNSLLMLEAMKAAKRPAEAHIFAKGGHGFGLGKAGTRAGTWATLFAEWLDQTMKGTA